jgi:hypothetical protein
LPEVLLSCPCHDYRHNFYFQAIKRDRILINKDKKTIW